MTVLCPTFFQTDIAKSGRFTDDKTRSRAESLVAKGKTADGVARYALEACRRDALYAIPMADGRWMWRLKRVSPVGFRNVAGRVAKRMFP